MSHSAKSRQLVGSLPRLAPLHTAARRLYSSRGKLGAELSVQRTFTSHSNRRRAYATATGAQQLGGFSQSHVISGLLGGAVVFLCGYGFYRYSGAHRVVSTANKLSSSSDPKVVLQALRQLAESYATTIPGAGFLVKQAFDKIDDLSTEHGEAVQKWVSETYQEVTESLQNFKGDNVSEKVMEIVQRKMGDLQKLTNSVGSSIITPLLEQNPKLKQLAGESFGQLQELAEKHGEEVRRIFDDTQEQLKRLASQGFNPSTLTEASHIVRTKLREAQELAKQSGEGAWREAQQRAAPILDKAPDLKKYLDSALKPIQASVGAEGSKLISDTFAELESIGKEGWNKESAQKARKLIQDRMEKIKDLAKKKAPEMPSIPGLDKLDLDGLKKLATNQAPEAKKLFEATINDLRQILEKRGEEAKNLGEETRREAKDKVRK